MIVIPLKIVAPIDITTQPVTLGVPFPRGVLHDPATLGLFDDAGKPVLLQTMTLAKWVDGSVRWLLIDFILVQVEAGCHYWNLDASNASFPFPPSSLAVTKTGEHYRIENGVANLLVPLRASKPLLSVKGLQSDSTDVVVDHVVAPMIPHALSDETRIEVQGPLRLVLQKDIRLKHRPECRMIVRFSFYADSSLVRLDLTLHNPARAKHQSGLWDLGDAASVIIKVLELRIAFPLANPQFLVQVHPNEPALELSHFDLEQLSTDGGNRNSRVHVNRHGEVRLPYSGFKLLMPGKDDRDGTQASPVVSVRDGSNNLTVVLADFWQNHPSQIAGHLNKELQKGAVWVGMFTRHGFSTQELQGGEQKTRTVWMEFNGKSDSKLSLQWVHQPALVHAAPEWVETCGALPFFPTSIAPGVAGERFAALMRDALEGPDSFFAKRERIDEYGWRHFGELYADHENEHYAGTKPIVSHYNNQYDALNGMLMMYFYTGDPRWWQLADPLARHLYDIDIYHTNQDRPAYNGGMFWHTDHYKDAATATHRAYSKANKPPGKPYGGGPGNEHNWSTGLLNYYYLTGDPLAREAVLSLANWVIDRDDGAKTFLGLIDDGPTGLSSRTGGDGSYHGPGRGGGNSINSLLDGWLLTDERRYLDKAEQLIRRCIHPADDLDALDMGNPEERWSYTVFLSVLVRYLELKRQADQVDERYAYARAALLHYGRWMAAHEKPYFDQVERLEFPNETWAAQEMRKANVLRLAARYAEEPERSAMLKRGDVLADRAWHDIYRFETRTSTRSLAILMTEGLRDSYLRTHTEERVTETGPTTEFGSPMNFAPQRTRVKRQLKSVKGILRAIPRLLNPWRWFRALRTKQWW